MTEAVNDDPLNDDVFAYRVSKDGNVFIAWHGKPAVTLRGKQAQRFVAQIAEADARGAQLLMAKATGNFKRGNERQAKKENQHR